MIDGFEVGLELVRPEEEDIDEYSMFSMISSSLRVGLIRIQRHASRDTCSGTD